MGVFRAGDETIPKTEDSLAERQMRVFPAADERIPET
jgi:hypothetical protein